MSIYRASRTPSVPSENLHQTAGRLTPYRSAPQTARENETRAEVSSVTRLAGSCAILWVFVAPADLASGGGIFAQGVLAPMSVILGVAALVVLRIFEWTGALWAH